MPELRKKVKVARLAGMSLRKLSTTLIVIAAALVTIVGVIAVLDSLIASFLQMCMQMH